MAFLRSTFASSMLLLALLVVASATDYYGYDPAPKVKKPEAKTDYKPHLPKPDYDEETKPYYNGYGPAPKVEKPEAKTDYKPHLTKPDYDDDSKPKTDFYDNGYAPAPKVEKLEAKADYKPHLTKPDYDEESKPKTDSYDNGYGPAPKVEKLEAETDYKSHPTKPDYEESKPKTNYYDNGYGPAPKVEESEAKTDYYDNRYGPASKVEKPEAKTDYKPQSTKPDYDEDSKPKTDNYDNGYGQAPKVENPKPKKDYQVEKPHPTKPNYYEVPKPKGKDEQHLLPTTIGVQGVVLCKSGSSYSPIQGAVARITCGCEDELGYETGSISVLSHVTDSKGYFFATVSLAELGSKLKVTGCKAYLESSPLETCKVPSDVNYGISGARLSSYRLLENNVKLYTVGPFFCTSQPAKPLPNNGY